MTGSTVDATGVRVHEAIRADILRGVHAPGAPLKLAPLAAQFGVSASVVREALVRLDEQHLATSIPNQGFRVVEISRADLLDLTELRVIVECRAVTRSIESGDIAWEADVVAAHHVLERAPVTHDDEPGSTDEWSRAHERFHDTLLAACGSPRLLASAYNLRASAEVYVQLSTGPSARDAAGEHRELLELALARRADDAARALERHIRLTCDLLLAGGSFHLPAVDSGVRGAVAG